MPRALPHLIFFFALIALWVIQAFSLGMSDDEAYYWVLSQNPSLGYAYHPPMVAWVIGISDWFLSPFSFLPHEGRVRFGGIVLSACFFWIGIQWARSVILEEQGREIAFRDLVFLVIPGLAGAGWMMVPDLPLFLGWSLCWMGSWKPLNRRAPVLLFLGALIGLLSKFSAILFIGSAAILIFFKVKKKQRLKLLLFLLTGTFIALIPTLYWNSQNDWVALRYQFLDRHQGGGSADLSRYLRFWASQLIVAGPGVLALMLTPSFWRDAVHTKRAWASLLWILPAAVVFWLQPLYSDFKAHWALAAWWPLALWATVLPSRPVFLSWAQGLGSITLVLVFTMFTQWPLQSTLTEWWIGRAPDPRWDVTNDLYGWSELPKFIVEKLGEDALSMPTLGSRYQTASQAAFAGLKAGLIGRRPGETQEWPSFVEHLEAASNSSWPALKKPVLFVADQRYSQGPAFQNASCQEVGILETNRGRHPAKQIRLWKCAPEPASESS